MKIASYNIYFGGYNYPVLTGEPVRLTEIVDAIRTIKADFISLNEAFRWDELFTKKDLQKLFGYKNVITVNLEDERLIKKGHNTCITVMTNYDVEYRTVRISTRNAVIAKLNINDKEFEIYCTYLDDMKEATRLAQMKEVLKNTTHNKPTIIMGDLNTFKKEDEKYFSKHIEEILETSSEEKKLYGDKVLEKAKCQVVKTIEVNGFHDLADKYQPTVPTNIKTLEKHKTRIDFAFGKNVKAKNLQVLTGGIFEKASDHYPIVFEV